MSEEKEKQTEELEEEELESAVEGEDDEEEDTRTTGQLVYEVMKKRGLVTDGDWDDLARDLKKKWEQWATDTSSGDVRQEMIDELS